MSISPIVDSGVRETAVDLIVDQNLYFHIGILGLAIFAACVALTIALSVTRKPRQTAESRSHAERDRTLKQRVSEKARLATCEREQEQLALAQDCATALLRVIDAHLDNENFSEAIKWAHHARNAMPDRPEFGVKLAETYFKRGDVSNFLIVARDLKVVLIGTRLKYWARVLVMGRKLTPTHALFATNKALSSVQVECAPSKRPSRLVPAQQRAEITGGKAQGRYQFRAPAPKIRQLSGN